MNKRNQINDVCIRQKVAYVSLPQNNPFNNFDSSASHGAALNYVWKNIVQPSVQIKYIMFLDYDIFPADKFNVAAILQDKPFYGLVQERGHKWYLWPGFCCYNKQAVSFEKMNFLPNEWGDTGASNF